MRVASHGHVPEDSESRSHGICVSSVTWKSHVHHDKHECCREGMLAIHEAIGGCQRHLGSWAVAGNSPNRSCLAVACMTLVLSRAAATDFSRTSTVLLLSPAVQSSGAVPSERLSKRRWIT